MATRGGHPPSHPAATGPAPAERYDVIVIGAGVVGCAVARRFVLEGAKVLVVEKAADILEGASKGNTAILHSGFDAPPGSLEHACIVNGRDQYLRIRSRLNLPLLETGALVLAWSEHQCARLEAVLGRARANGIDRATLLTAAQVLAREPHLAAEVKAAVDIPGEAVIDPWSAPYIYLLQAVENGARLLRNCEVSGGHFDGREWVLASNRQPLRGAFVVNCAGLYGDRIDARLLGQSAFQIRPRKGQFLVYDKSASRLLKAILLPPPGEAGKGVIICRTVFGNVLVGPSSEPQRSRRDASVSAPVLRELRRLGERRVPALAAHAITATYAGIRPATQFQDYRIAARPERNYLSVGGIRSTGLSAALGIAGHVFAAYTRLGKRHTAPARASWPRAAALAEHQVRDWQAGGNGGIVCHCELVTRREIRRALGGPLPAASLGALKRRTRAGMGRCQGFYCNAGLSRLTRGHFAEQMAWPAEGGGRA